MPEVENEKLVRALDDLFRLSALQSDWKDLDEDAVAESLASVLVKTLHADFAYVTISTLHVMVELACSPKGRLSPAFVPTIRNSVLGAAADGGKIVSPVNGFQRRGHVAALRLRSCPSTIICRFPSSWRWIWAAAMARPGGRAIAAAGCVRLRSPARPRLVGQAAARPACASGAGWPPC